MRQMLRLFLFYITILLCSPLISFADDIEESYYSDLHKGYVELSREDPNVTQRAKWDDLIGEANAFAARGLSDEVAPKTFYLLARIHEHIYDKHKEDQALAAALEWCERVALQHTGSELADDALFAIGELEEEGRGDKDAARKAYQKIVDEYPESNMLQKANQRLAGLGGAKPKKKKGLLAKIFGEPKTASRNEFYSVHRITKLYPRQPVIVIDPGHGGEEEGALGRNGVLEKDVVLNISLILEEYLRKRLEAKTVLTRVRDVTVELSQRTQLANQHRADLFISVHANASPSKRLSGIETYYLDNTDNKSSLRLAKRENASSQQKMTDLGFMLSDLIQNAKLEDSISLAHYVQESLVSKIREKFPDTRDLGVKKAPFFVLVGAHMPCVLAEVSFIDHKVEGQRLATREYQQLVAESLYLAIAEYLEHRWVPEQLAKGG